MIPDWLFYQNKQKKWHYSKAFDLVKKIRSGNTEVLIKWRRVMAVTVVHFGVQWLWLLDVYAHCGTPFGRRNWIPLLWLVHWFSLAARTRVGFKRAHSWKPSNFDLTKIDLVSYGLRNWIPLLRLVLWFSLAARTRVRCKRAHS